MNIICLVGVSSQFYVTINNPFNSLRREVFLSDIMEASSKLIKVENPSKPGRTNLKGRLQQNLEILVSEKRLLVLSLAQNNSWFLLVFDHQPQLDAACHAY